MKLKTCFFSFVAVVVLSLVGCWHDTPSGAAAPVYESGSPEALDVVYQYTGYSRQGTPIVQGYLMLSQRDPNHYTGRWHLRALVDTMRIGPQVGQGNLVGEIRNGALTINLNPNFVDNNVILTGRLRRTVYAGRWEWIGFAGTLNSGTFQAVRRPFAEEAYEQ